MRLLLYVAAATGVAILVPPSTLRAALATAASTLFEATPWLLAGIVAARIFRRSPAIVPYLGCGCGAGPSARSLPAAALTCIVFGPIVAFGRLAAAIAVARSVRASHAHAADHELDLLAGLASLVPAAVVAGIALQITAILDVATLRPFAQIALGIVLGFAGAPCALGAIAIAGALHAHAPLASLSFLCIAGILDIRALFRWRSHAHAHARHDVFAYVSLTIALCIVAMRRGDQLVHPSLALALGACGIATAYLLVRYRSRVDSATRLAPVLMLAGALVTAPPPTYRATETTLSDLFPGERLTFTGLLTPSGRSATLVRYAITCCRADATPIVIRLARRPAVASNAWLRADGTVRNDIDGFYLAASRIETIAPPADPFVYR